jgi:1-acyl-sn-glycerol-3-phosphate acyltransferase
MIGTEKVQPIGKRLPNIRRIGIIFGQPLDFSRYYGQEEDRSVQRAVTDEIMYELMRLSGQEYVDEYATVVKQRIAGQPPGPAGGSEPHPADTGKEDKPQPTDGSEPDDGDGAVSGKV